MKIKLTYLLFFAVASATFIACSSKKTEQDNSASQDQVEWPEMESFHMVMAEAYHPYKDSANLEPVKSLAENLAKESEKWAGATLPRAVDDGEVKAKLEKLRKDCRALADQVKSGASNEQIGAALTALHETFHTIMEAWHKAKDAI